MERALTQSSSKSLLTYLSAVRDIHKWKRSHAWSRDGVLYINTSIMIPNLEPFFGDPRDHIISSFMDALGTTLGLLHVACIRKYSVQS